MSNIIKFPVKKETSNADKLLIRFVKNCKIVDQAEKIEAFTKLQVAIFDYVYLGYYRD